MANFLRKVQATAKLRAIKRKRSKLQAQLKVLGRKYRSTFKSEAKRLSRKKRKTSKRKK